MRPVRHRCRIPNPSDLTSLREGKQKRWRKRREKEMKRGRSQQTCARMIPRFGSWRLTISPCLPGCNGFETFDPYYVKALKKICSNDVEGCKSYVFNHGVEKDRHEKQYPAGRSLFFLSFFLYSHPPEQTVASEINADPPAIRLGEDTPLNCFSQHQKNRR